MLSVGILYHRTAIPVAWAITRANAPGAWLPQWERLLPQWERLLATLLPALPPGAWCVLVLADRRLHSPHLFAAIQAQSWHPLLRLQRPLGGAGWGWVGLASAVAERGDTYAARVLCFRGQPVPATLLGLWEPDHAELWLLLTDLPPDGPEALSPQCYALRMWIECGFKALKRGGWGWHCTQMTDPARAERLWLVLALATLWVVAVGGQDEAEQATVTPATGRLPRPRISVFTRGLVRLRVAWLGGHDLPPAVFRPLPWPSPKTYP